MQDKNFDPLNEYFKDIGALVKEIDRKEEAALWPLAQKGNKAAREKLFKMHIRLVVPTAKRFYRRGVEIMDLIEEGNLGLLHAIERFDYRKGYRFSTYAIHWIEQYIRRAVEEQSGAIKIPSHAWENLRLWGKTWERLKQKLSRPPTLREMADSMNISARQVQSILSTLSAAYSVDSLSASVNEEDDITLEDTLTDDGKGNPDSLVEGRASNKDLLKILHTLAPRDREVLTMRYGLKSDEEMTLAQAAKKLGISRERVRQIEERAVRLVRKLAQESGLFERRERDRSTRQIYAGMRGKNDIKTDVLGRDYAASKIARLIAAAARKNKPRRGK